MQEEKLEQYSSSEASIMLVDDETTQAGEQNAEQQEESCLKSEVQTRVSKCFTQKTQKS